MHAPPHIRKYIHKEQIKYAQNLLLKLKLRMICNKNRCNTHQNMAPNSAFNLPKSTKSNINMSQKHRLNIALSSDEQPSSIAVKSVALD